jgi:hypothetical protein
LLDFLRKPVTLDKSTASIGELRAKVEAGRAAIDQARDAFRSAALADAEGAEGADAAGASRALADAERTLAASEAALSAALTRHALVEETHTAKERAKRWRQVEALAKEREAVAAEIEREIGTLAASVAKLQKLTGDMVRANPGADRVPHDLFRARNVGGAIGVEMARQGIEGVSAALWGREALVIGPAILPESGL